MRRKSGIAVHARRANVPLLMPAFFDLIANFACRNYNVCFRKAALPNRLATLPCESPTTNRYILPNLPSREESSFVKQPDLQLTTILSHPFEQNTYIAWLRDRADCVVVDPGLEPEKIIRHLEQQGFAGGHSEHARP